MAIKSRTRKVLWAKSGNRCALCRLELVQDIEGSDNLILGEECHIISGKENGPRGKIGSNNRNFDDYDNLILLCTNDHTRIDSLTEIYDKEKLKKIKFDHEEWVKATLSIDPLYFTNDKFKVISLKRMKTGKELVSIFDGSHATLFDDSTINSKENIIPDLFDNLKEYVEVFDLMSFKEKAVLGDDLDETIKEIEQLGFLLFAIKRKFKTGGNKDSLPLNFVLATLVIVESNNPGIVGEFIIMKTPVKFNFG